MASKGETFIRLPHSLVRGAVWVDLSANATRLLIAIWALYDGRNNGRIRFSARDAEATLKCSPNTALKVFRELEAAGLIEAVHRGGFRYRADGGRGTATVWRISPLPMNENQR
jgi:Mn-dependent DtxR family transcriptional regulator